MLRRFLLFQVYLKRAARHKKQQTAAKHRRTHKESPPNKQQSKNAASQTPRSQERVGGRMTQTAQSVTSPRPAERAWLGSSWRQYAPYAWMLAGCFCIACMNQLAYQMKGTCDWRVIALSRAGLAFAFAFALAKFSGARLVLWKPPALWLRGAASSVSLLCTFYALSQIQTAEVNTLTN